MVKKLKNSRLLRVSFSLISCFLVLVCCAAPAFAYGVDFDSNNSLVPLLTGNLDISFYANDVHPQANVGQYIVSIGLPTTYSFTPTNNKYYDMAEYIEYYNKPVTGSGSEWQDFELDIMAGRWKTTLGSQTAWQSRTDITAWSMLDPDNNAYFDKATFYFDSFSIPLDYELLNKLFAINVRSPMKVNFSADVYFVNSSGQLDHANYSSTQTFSSAPYRNVFAFFDSGHMQTFENWCLVNGLTVGQPVLISEFTATVDASANKTYGNLTGIQFQTLTRQFFDGVMLPEYWNPDRKISWFIDHAFDELQYGSSTPPAQIEGDVWSEWIGGVITGFFDAEIMPGFSFGSVFSVMMTIIFVLIILRFFAGG